LDTVSTFLIYKMKTLNYKKITAVFHTSFFILSD